jgi:peptidyl-prolyl cis-trans isomerase D
MLSVMRDSVGGWVAKIFIGLLALSFAAWGISDIFTGTRGTALAVVGDQEISREDYELAFQRRLQALSNQFGGQTITAEAGRTLGVHRTVLAEMIRNAVIDGQVDELALAVSDTTIAARIAADERFHDAQGRFDRLGFQQLLAANGLTEQGYVALERENILRGEVISAVSGGLGVPVVMLEALSRQQNETRSMRYVTVPESAIDDVPDPSEEEQQAYYDENKRSFTAPEFRTLSILRLNPEDVAETLTVAEDEVRQVYDRRIADYTTQETREIQQIAFDTVEEAEAARARIAQGDDFVAIAEERGLKPVDYSLGQLEKSEIADQAIADAAFALGLDEVSAPVEGKLSVVLLRITAIQPANVKPFEEVRSEIETRLGLERAQEEILNLHDAVEDARAEGATLREIGEKFDLPVIDIDAVDQSGNDPQGKPVEGIPAQTAVLNTAFESDIGVENDPVDTEEEGFAWVDVLEVTPPAIRSLEDVRDDIVELWKAKRSRDALLDKAKELLELARAGTGLDAIAQEYAQEVQEVAGVKRSDRPERLAATAIDTMFRTPLDGFALAQNVDGQSFILFQVSAVEAPEFSSDSAEAQSLRDQLVTTMTDDLLSQFVGGLQEDIGIEINEAMWRQLHGEAS